MPPPPVTRETVAALIVVTVGTEILRTLLRLCAGNERWQPVDIVVGRHALGLRNGLRRMLLRLLILRAPLVLLVACIRLRLFARRIGRLLIAKILWRAIGRLAVEIRLAL